MEAEVYCLMPMKCVPFEWIMDCIKEYCINDIPKQEIYAAAVYDAIVPSRWRMPPRLSGEARAPDVIELIALLSLSCLNQDGWSRQKANPNGFRSMKMIILWCLGDVKPLSEPVMGHWHLDPQEQTSLKMQSKYFHSRKCILICRLVDFGHFVSVKPLVEWVLYRWI